MSASVPVGLKQKDLLGQPWALAFALRADGWYLRSCVIWAKCLSGGTRVYARTQKGEMPMTVKDLVRLRPETVELWNGERWTCCVSFSESSRDTQVEIELRNGERIGCTPEHRWPTGRGLLDASELRPGDVIQSAALPEPEHPRSFLPDEEIGYLVGLYIAEGSMSADTVQIACHADQADGIAERLGATTAIMHGTAVAHRTGGKKATVNLNGPITAAAVAAYVNGSGAKRKHLSPRAWARSNRFLRAVLDGYLDGDGHRDGRRWRLGFTANDQLAADLRTLGARLGVSVRLRRCVHHCQSGDFPGWRGEIADVDYRRTDDREIVAIRRSRARKFWDIQVADDPHLFALASGTLTHNSNPMPESVTDRPTTSHEYVFLLTKQPRYWYDAEAVKEPNVSLEQAAHTARYAKRYEKYDEKTADRKQPGNNNHKGIHARGGNTVGRNLRSVWTIPTFPYPEAHFATYPPALVERCLQAGCAREVCRTCGKARERIVERGESDYARIRREEGHEWTDMDAAALARGVIARPGEGGQTRRSNGTVPSLRAAAAVSLGFTDCCHGDYRRGLVLDPFAGSGTTLVVARRLGLDSIGIELNPEYARMIERRMARWWEEPSRSRSDVLDGQLVFEEVS